jgi:hypothetical protein
MFMQGSRGSFTSAWSGADASSDRIDKMLRANDEAMIFARLGNIDKVAEATSIQEQIVDDLHFSLTEEEVDWVDNAFLYLWQSIGKIKSNTPTDRDMVLLYLKTMNRLISWHLAKMKITFNFSENITSYRKLRRALGLPEEEEEPENIVKEEEKHLDEAEKETTEELQNKIKIEEEQKKIARLMLETEAMEDKEEDDVPSPEATA